MATPELFPGRFRSLTDSGERSLEPVQERRLRVLDLRSSLPEVEPTHPVDLGEGPRLPRPRRPFHLVGVADRGVGIEVAFERPCHNALPRLLPDLAELDRGSTGRIRPGLLGELAPGHVEQVLAGFGLALQDRPMSVVLPGPVRPAWVAQQHLHAGLDATPQEDPGAGSAGLVDAGLPRRSHPGMMAGGTGRVPDQGRDDGREVRVTTGTDDRAFPEQ